MSNENPNVEIDPDHELHVTETDDVPVDETVHEAASASDGDSIEALKQQLADAEKRALLYQADLENFRRRKAKESQDAVKYASMPLINGLLLVLDNLDRALESAAAEEHASSLKEGVELVRTQLLAALESNGCKRIESVGQVFDPNVHEAIQMQPDKNAPQNTIIMEAQSGFLLHDRVVRPAKVIISTGPARKK